MTSLAPEERVSWPQGLDRALSVRQKWFQGRSCGGSIGCASDSQGARMDGPRSKVELFAAIRRDSRTEKLLVPPTMRGRALYEAMHHSTGTESPSPKDRRVIARRSTTDITTAHFQEYSGRHYFLSAERHRT